ncbi:MAG: transporter [Gammaproteobacteria bacterium]|nr:transporter [Gammaproteobacteria bacterium]
MNHWRVRGLVLFTSLAVASSAFAQEATVDKAREALAQQEGDADSAKQLEEVFQAAEKNYSLLKAGAQSLTYSIDYSYTADQRLDLQIVNNSIRNLDITPSATHTFTNSFSYDFGVLDNLTVGVRIPLVSKFDTQAELSNNDMGDVSVTTRWQPAAYVPGKMSTTMFASFKSKTGVSPYEIDINRQLSSGSGYYSASAGASVSKVLDPVVLFGSLSISYNLKEEGLQQVRGARLLQEVEPGFGLSMSSGFAYSLSYDISLSASFQLSYSDETVLKFNDGTQAVAQDQMTGFLSFSLGTRVSDKTIINTNVGFGLTEDAPDFSLGVSLPINISGLKE